jgi:glycosyltransferase involved in cell wall biosynthesis
VTGNRPRVRFFTTSFPREPEDAAGGFVAGLASGLAAGGVEVSVEAAVSDWGPPGVRTRAWARGNPLFLGAGAPDRLAAESGSPGVRSEAARAGLQVLARGLTTRGTHDVAVGHWLVPCGPAARAAGGRVVLYAHGSDVALLESLPGGRALARVLDLGAAHLNFVSADLARRFEALLGRAPRAATTVLPMGLADPAPDPDALAIALRGLPPVPRAVVHVVTVGRLVRLKGLDVLARALAGRPDVVWTAAGDGPERGPLEALCRSLGVDVRLPGALPPGARDALLRQADVFVLPSRPLGRRSEGTPLALLEAQLAGLPCVASDVGGVRDAAANEGVRCVPPDDPPALRAALAAWLDGPDAGNRRAEAGRSAAAFADRFRWVRLLPAHRAAILGAVRPGGTSCAWR